jgi:ankyrin repeat protein
LEELASILIPSSKEINRTTPSGFTALDIALFNGNVKLAEQLTAAGATANSFKTPNST